MKRMGILLVAVGLGLASGACGFNHNDADVAALAKQQKEIDDTRAANARLDKERAEAIKNADTQFTKDKAEKDALAARLHAATHPDAGPPAIGSLIPPPASITTPPAGSKADGGTPAAKGYTVKQVLKDADRAFFNPLEKRVTKMEKRVDAYTGTVRAKATTDGGTPASKSDGGTPPPPAAPAATASP